MRLRATGRHQRVRLAERRRHGRRPVWQTRHPGQQRRHLRAGGDRGPYRSPVGAHHGHQRQGRVPGHPRLHSRHARVRRRFHHQHLVRRRHRPCPRHIRRLRRQQGRGAPVHQVHRHPVRRRGHPLQLRASRPGADPHARHHAGRRGTGSPRRWDACRWDESAGPWKSPTASSTSPATSHPSSPAPRSSSTAAAPPSSNY